MRDWLLPLRTSPLIWFWEVGLLTLRLAEDNWTSVLLLGETEVVPLFYGVYLSILVAEGSTTGSTMSLLSL